MEITYFAIFIYSCIAANMHDILGLLLYNALFPQNTGFSDQCSALYWQNREKWLTLKMIRKLVFLKKFFFRSELFVEQVILWEKNTVNLLGKSVISSFPMRFVIVA